MTSHGMSKFKKLTWIMTWWYERWEYQDETGKVFGCVQKTGGAMRNGRPIEYLWFRGTSPGDPKVVAGNSKTQKEAKVMLEKLYEDYAKQEEVNDRTTT